MQQISRVTKVYVVKTRMKLTAKEKAKRKRQGKVMYRLRWDEVIHDGNGEPVYDEDGRLKLHRRSISARTRDKVEAQKLAAIKFHELNGLATPAEPEAKSKTLSELRELEAEHLAAKGCAEDTIYLTKLSFNHFITVVGDLPIDSITAENILTFKTTRLGRGISHKSLHRELGSVRAGFRRAVRTYRLLGREHNLFDDPEVMPKVTRYQPRPLTLDEQRKLLEACEEDGLELHTFVSFCLDTGCRANEAAHCLWADVDLVNGVAHVRCRQTFKTKNRRPHIAAFTKTTALLLARWKRQRRKRPELFANPAEPSRRCYQRMRRRFLKAVASAGLSEVGLHDLRRTRANDAYVAGVEQRTTAAALGHATTEMTERYQANVPIESLRAAMDRVDAYRRTG